MIEGGGIGAVGIIVAGAVEDGWSSGLVAVSAHNISCGQNIQ